MGSDTATTQTPTRLRLTRIPDSWAWIQPDLLVRLGPFTLAFGIAYWVSGGAPWLGLGPGTLAVQLIFAAVATPLMFAAAVAGQLLLTRPPGGLRGPAGPAGARVPAALYA